MKLFIDNIFSKDRELKEKFNCNFHGIQLTKKTMDKSFEPFFDKESPNHKKQNTFQF